MADKFYPDYDFQAYMVKACVTEHKQQREDTSLQQFFETIEAMMAQEHTRITDAHIMYDQIKDVVYIWFAAVFKEVFDDMRGKLPWSKNALLRALREEEYYIREDQKINMGTDGAKRTVITLSLKNAPEVLRNVAGVNK